MRSAFGGRFIGWVWEAGMRSRGGPIQIAPAVDGLRVLRPDVPAICIVRSRMAVPHLIRQDWRSHLCGMPPIMEPDPLPASDGLQARDRWLAHVAGMEAHAGRPWTRLLIQCRCALLAPAQFADVPRCGGGAPTITALALSSSPARASRARA